ncbi:non-ribosomal peptide synthetase, partial [Paenibacillus sp. Marseille-Q9583]
MNFLLIQSLDYFSPSNEAYKASRMLMENMAAKGHNCYVIIPVKFEKKFFEIYPNELKRKSLKSFPNNYVDIVHLNGVDVYFVADGIHSYIQNQIIELNPTWVLVSDDETYETLSAVLKAVPKNILFIAHNRSHLPFGPESLCPSIDSTQLVSKVSGIITISQYVKDYIEKWSDLKAELVSLPAYGTSTTGISLEDILTLVSDKSLTRLPKKVESVLDVLSEEKKGQLALLLKKKREGAKLVRNAGRALYPISYGQESLWLFDQFNHLDTTYNVISLTKLVGQLDVLVLHKSVEQIIDRHEILRTTFQMVEGLPMQVVHEVIPTRIEVLDMTDCSGVEQESRVRQWVDVQERTVLDLRTDPLFSVKVLKLSPNENILVISIHHIISDGWSSNLLIGELVTLYEAYVEGKESALTELPYQYGDYALWQREGLKGGELKRLLTYWNERLKGELPVLRLPTDYPRPAVQSYRGSSVSFQINKELTQQLKSVSQMAGASLFMLLLGAFQTLLYRYTGQEDIVVGTPVANRNLSEIEGLIGLFANTLVIRTDLSGSPTFAEVIQRVREVALGAYAHQDLPFGKLVQEIQPVRDQSYSPLFQVIFVLQHASEEGVGFKNLEQVDIAIEEKTSKFDLTLSLIEGKEGLTGTIEYCTDLFLRESMERMASHMTELLRGVAENPDQRIGELQLLSKDEAQQILFEWQGQEVEVVEQCLHEQFENQVRRNPEAVAVVYGEERVSYGELNQRANQWAHYLQSQGVGPDDLVGIYMERSVEMLVGLLAVLKAGGAYVPLDPAYPRERIAYMMEDTQVRVLFTQEKLGGGMPENKATVYYLDQEPTDFPREAVENPVSGVTPQNLVYAIYTSGSTGKPKGVLIEHASVLNNLLDMIDVLPIEASDTVLSSTSLSFDPAGVELFAPLLVGAQILIVDSVKSVDQAVIANVTMMQGTPSTFRMLRKLDIQQKKMLIGGEALPVEMAKDYIHKNNTVWNVYGPTETTIWSTYHKVEEKQGSTASSVPIGRPLPKDNVYILNRELQVVPIGVPGELCIGGTGVARAYLNRPELTAEKFIPHPFKSGERLYKTGDLARWLPDGNIEYLGRMDDQVKIRGYRIELGEIQTLLTGFPEVEEAIVVARKDGEGQQSLCAYVVADTPLAVADLRSYL